MVNIVNPKLSLGDLQRVYPAAPREVLLDIADRYRQRREQDLIEVVSLATELTVEQVRAALSDPGLHPQIAEAVQLAYPREFAKDGWDGIEAWLGDKSSSELQGVINGLKGKYFEVVVRDRLNAGNQIGELVLGPGQVADLAESATQRGWDMRILNPDGSLAEAIQLKATHNLSYVKEALERYPGIRVATTSEIDGTADAIIQTGMSDQVFEEGAAEAVDHLSESAIEAFAEAVGEFAVTAVPVLPAVVVAFTEGRAILTGRSTMEDALARAAKRMRRPLVFSVIGASLIAVDAGFLSIPVTVTGHVIWTRVEQRAILQEMLRPRHQAIEDVVRTMREGWGATTIGTH